MLLVVLFTPGVHALQCCFVDDGGVQYIRLSLGTCTVGIDLGPLEAGFVSCEEKYTLASCKISNTICYNTIQGRILFNGVDASRQLCDGVGGTLTALDRTCVDSIGEIEDPVEEPTENPTNSSNPYIPIESGGQQEISLTCGAAGFPYGVFYDKTSCEAITGCVYDPIRIGLMGYDDRYALRDEGGDLIFQGYEDYERDVDLYSCKPSTSIGDCFDVKSQQGCQEREECTWIGRENYGEGVTGAGGICVADTGEESVFLNEKNIIVENIIRNPSFELGVHWQGSGVQFVRSPRAFNGKHVAVLEPSGVIRQRIVAPIKTYSFGMFIQENQAFTFEDSLLVTLGAYGAEGTLVDERIIEVGLGNYNTLDGVFSGYPQTGAQSYTPPQGTEVIEINIQNVGASQVTIDGVSLIAPDRGVFVQSSFYEESLVLPAGASNCEKCFKKQGFNDCTEEKSSILGECHYTVESVQEPYVSQLTQYSGRRGGEYINYFMQSYDRQWLAQSLPEAYLFCEMFVSAEQCLSGGNKMNEHVARLHPSSGETLCKWDATIGCFKDSDDDNIPDVFSQDEKELAGTATLGSIFHRDEQQTRSHFTLSCDTIPPYAYMYMLGQTTEGEVLVIHNESEILIGNPKLFLYVHELLAKACELYKVSMPQALLGYTIRNSQGVFVGEQQLQTKQNGLVSFKEILGEDVQVIEDGKNELLFSIYDRSGNIGYQQVYSVVLDARGPTIDIIGEIFEEFEPGVFVNMQKFFRQGSNITIEAHDASSLEYCRYQFEFAPGSSAVYRKEPIQINVSNSSNLTTVLALGEYIQKTGPGGDYVTINVTCADIYEQITSQVYVAKVDFESDFVMQDPLPFFGFSYPFGYIQSAEQFRGVSSEEGLESCQLEIGEFQTEGVIESKTQTIDGAVFRKEITFSLGEYVLEQGSQLVTVRCQGALDQPIEKEFIYYVDPLVPELRSFGVDQGHCDEKGLCYTIIEDPVLHVEFDGTLSPIAQLDLFFKGCDGVKIPIEYNVERQKNYSNGVFIDRFSISDTVDLDFSYGCEHESNRFTRTYIFETTDRAGNSQNFERSYVYDANEPGLVFSGEVYAAKNVLYALERRPRITLGFSNYIPHTCSYQVKNFRGVAAYEIRELGEGYEFTFTIDSPASHDFNEGGILAVNCVDQYGNVLAKEYRMAIKTSVPRVDPVVIPGRKAYVYQDGALFDDYQANISFIVTSNEEELFCKYWFSSDNYTCDTSIKAFDWRKEMNVPHIRDVTLLGSGGNAVCQRSSQSVLGKTTMTLTTECFDGLDQSSGLQTKEIHIDIVDGLLVDMRYQYTERDVIVEVAAVTPEVEMTFFAPGIILELQPIYSHADGIYYYTGSFKKSQFQEGKYIGVATVKGSGGESIQEAFFIDRRPPTIYDGIIGEKPLGNMSSEVPQVMTFVPEAIDEGTFASGLQEVHIVLEGDLGSVILVDAAHGVINKQYLTYTEDFPMENANRLLEKSFSGYMEMELPLGTYELIMMAEDRGGNKVNTTKELVVVPTLMLRTGDTATAKAYGRTSWVTRSEQPEIAFELINGPASCTVYPYTSSVYSQGVRDQGRELGMGSLFSINLEEFEAFNASLRSVQEIRVECLQEGQLYEFIPLISYIDFLPDYVYEPLGPVIVADPENFGTIHNVRGYPELRCNLGLNTTVIQEPILDDFTQGGVEVGFTSIPNNGETRVFYQCEDALGQRGLIKNFTYIISDEFSFTKIFAKGANPQYEYMMIEEEGVNVIYVPDATIDLHMFGTKSPEEVDCSYRVSENSLLAQVTHTLFDLLGDIGYELAFIEEGFGTLYVIEEIPVTEEEMLFSLTCVGDDIQEYNEDIVIKKVG